MCHNYPLIMQRLGWEKGKQYLRLDGKVSAQARQQGTRMFNDPKSSVQVPASRPHAHNLLPVVVALHCKMLLARHHQAIFSWQDTIKQ